jgi:hypothetical protein
MSIFDKIKRIFSEPEKANASSVKRRIVPINEIHQEMKNFLIKHEKDEASLASEISDRIRVFRSETAVLISVLEKIDLAQKKESENLKLLVLDNLNLYVSYLKILVSKLDTLKSKKPNDCINSAFALLNEFNKKAHISFEKATILIGKDIATTKETIKAFGNDLVGLAERNKTLFEKDKIADEMKNLLQELMQNKAISESFDENIITFNSEIKKADEEAKEIQNKISYIKNSEDYKKEIEERERMRGREIEMEKDLRELKGKINFKSLANVFHSNKKHSQFIKDYASDFKQALKNDENLELLNLIKDAKHLDVPALREAREEILNLNNSHVIPMNKHVLESEEELKSREMKKARLYENIKKEIKKKERLSAKTEILAQNIKSLSSRLFPELEIV